MKNVAASIRARLLNLSRSSGESFNDLLEQYATGRFLWRLSVSPYRDQFILKGAQLFRLWKAHDHRPTRDLDFLGFGDPSETALLAIFSEVCEQSLKNDDGLVWGEIVTGPIRGELEYGGVRARLAVTLDGARIGLQIDIGFGDAVFPEPVRSEWESLLDFPSITLLAYPPETVIAEKLEAAVSLEMGNSRMKDFFDLHWLSNNQTFDLIQLGSAIRATFERRGTPLPAKIPLALTEEFGADEGKNIQWNAFLRKGKLQAPALPEVITTLSRFLWPVIKPCEKSPEKSWTPGKGWHD